MNSYRGSPRRGRLVTIALLAAGVFLILTFARDTAGGVASFLFTPVVSVERWIAESSGAIPSYLRTQGALVERIQALEEELSLRADDAFALTALRAEHELLAAASSQAPDGAITASVLAQPGSTPYDTLIIDRGARDGIAHDALVYAGEGAAIGTIAAVYEKSALVLLASAPSVHSTAYVFGPNIFTDAEGRGGGTLRIEVPQGVPLAVGNLVMLPGAGAGAYGEIVEVEALESSPYQYGYVTSPVPLRSMRYVHVARSPRTEVSYAEAQAAVTAASTTLFAVPVPATVLVGTSTATTTKVE